MTRTAEPFRLVSTAFLDGGTIPERHTCEGEDLSPPLAWSGVPSEARSFVVLCTDPDAPGGRFVHWVLFNLPSDAAELAEGVPPRPELPSGARHGLTDFGRVGWGGPCPPPGRPHRYVFSCLALRAQVNLAPGATLDELRRAIADDVLGEATLTGTFGR